MRDRPEPLDRLVAGELSRPEERSLAQAALDDPELFDALTAASITRVALTPDVPRRSRRWVAAVAALAAAAALVLAVAYGTRTNGPSPSPQVAPPASAALAPLPPPVILSARLDATPAPTFRADAAPSRQPKPSGTIVQIGDDAADVDLGSLDGLSQGQALSIVHENREVGRMTITAVFRERARGRLATGVAARQGDRVDVDPATHVGAILEQVAAKRGAGDVSGARDLARLAESRARADSVPTDIRQRAIAELADVLNELGAIQIDRREFPAAEQTLESARPFAVGATRARVENNLGAIAALRGDRDGAERLYRVADTYASELPHDARERQAIAANLAALHTSR